jgi:hypothetical protein
VGSGFIGFWILGIGVNYIPLAVYSVVLFAGDRLDRELVGVDLWPRDDGPAWRS